MSTPRAGRRLAVALAVLGMALLTGCATLPADPARHACEALAADIGGPLAQAAFATRPSAGVSGFRLLPSGAQALATRLELARQARRSIDVQSFIVQGDATGREFLRTLRDAAARGVRVRLLVDDLFTGDDNELLSTFAAHANVEVRLFNPFMLRSGGVIARFAAQPFSFERLNHRMHNKLFAVDGVVGITGGRNIGDEYFSRRDAGNFIDLEVLSAGPVVLQMAAQFDRYWNDSLSVDVGVLEGEARRDTAIDRFEAMTKQAIAPAAPFADESDAMGRRSPSEELMAGKLELAWGEGESFADPPGKVVRRDVHDTTYGASPVRAGALERIRAARRDVLLTSPYFIPGADGVALLGDAVARGARVAVLTNSLASTDQPLVHGAYRRYRRDLLLAGIELNELTARHQGQEARTRAFGIASAGLHTKCLVIDRSEVLIGSMNFDPRSDHFNTENGLSIRVPEIAAEAAALFGLAKREAASQLHVDEHGHLVWTSGDGGVVHDREPEAALGRRLWMRLLGILAPERLL